MQVFPSAALPGTPLPCSPSERARRVGLTRPWALVASAARRVWQSFARQQRAHREQRALSQLSDRTLRDLGLAERAPLWHAEHRQWDLERW